MLDIRTSSDSVVGVALMHLGIHCHPHSYADHSQDWVNGDWKERLKRRFGPFFDKRNDPDIIVVVDGASRNYRVRNLDDLESIWRHAQINHVFTMTKDAFDTIGGDVVWSGIPRLDKADALAMRLEDSPGVRQGGSFDRADGIRDGAIRQKLSAKFGGLFTMTGVTIVALVDRELFAVKGIDDLTHLLMKSASGINATYIVPDELYRTTRELFGVRDVRIPA